MSGPSKRAKPAAVAHRGPAEPSAQSLAEMPEVDFTKSKAVRRGPRAVKGRPATLRLLRIASDKTQVAIADASGINQGALSRLERQPLGDRYLATIARYVEALGGRLELVAVFPSGERIRVVDPDEV